MFQVKAVETIKTHILCSVTFFRKSCRLWDNVEKYGRAGQDTDGNMAWRVRFGCWINKATDTHTHTVSLSLRICNIYCFSTAKMVARTRLNVTLHVHCLCCPLLYREIIAAVLRSTQNKNTLCGQNVELWNAKHKVTTGLWRIIRLCVLPHAVTRNWWPCAMSALC
jgi:hypothetical protein